MANPARILLRLFESWMPENNQQSSGEARGINNHSDAPAWSNIRLAFVHIDGIERLLDQLSATGSNVAVYQSYVPIWTAAAAAYPRGWIHTGDTEFLPAGIEHLKTLADRLDDVVQPIAANGIEQVQTLIGECAKILSEDTSIPDDMRKHLTEVLLHVKKSAEGYTLIGDFELAKAVDELLAVLGRVAEKSKDGRRWSEAVNGFVYPFTATVAATLATPGLQALIPGTS